MIAAYRAARLSARPVLRTGLRESRVALRQSRDNVLHLTAQAADTAPTSPSDEPPTAVAMLSVDKASIFASLVNLAVAERDALVAPSPPDNESEVEEVSDCLAKPVSEAPAPAEPEPVADPQFPRLEDSTPEPVAVLPAPEAKEATAAAPSLPPAIDPPLAEIGFGPGMLIRLSQIGLRTTSDLARADAAELRAALGDISRLVDVETWISHARHLHPKGPELPS